MLEQITYGKESDSFADANFYDEGIKKLCREIVLDSIKNLRLYAERYVSAEREENKLFALDGINFNKAALRQIDHEWLVCSGYKNARMIRRFIDKAIAMEPQEFLSMGEFKIKGLNAVQKRRARCLE